MRYIIIHVCCMLYVVQRQDMISPTIADTDQSGSLDLFIPSSHTPLSCGYKNNIWSKLETPLIANSFHCGLLQKLSAVVDIWSFDAAGSIALHVR